MMTEKQQIREYKKWFRTKDKRGTHPRWDILNHLIKVFGYNTYLEIGVRSGDCISRINAPQKHGVDPSPSKHVGFIMTSDEFFSSTNNIYDLVFIDGLHHAGQVYKDIVNSLDHLSAGGTIVCHDMNPPFEICQRPQQVVSTWNGDCWKAFAFLRSERDDIEMMTVDTDFGLGIIRRGSQEKISVPNNVDYQYLSAHRNDLLNLITVDQFFTKFPINE